MFHTKVLEKIKDTFDAQ